MSIADAIILLTKLLDLVLDAVPAKSRNRVVISMQDVLKRRGESIAKAEAIHAKRK